MSTVIRYGLDLAMTVVDYHRHSILHHRLHCQLAVLQYCVWGSAFVCPVWQVQYLHPAVLYKDCLASLLKYNT